MNLQVKRLHFSYIFFFFYAIVLSQTFDYESHTAVKSETLFQIARQYNTDIQTIYSLNPQFQDKILQIGDIVKVPKLANNNNKMINSSEFLILDIVSGDTKFGLSKKHNVSIQTLENLNPHIKSMLQVGHKVRVPSATSNYEENSSNSSSSNNLVNGETSNTNNEYLVQPGDTLWGIAKENAISVNSLIATNKSRLDGVLKSGQYLIIPKDEYVANNNVEASTSVNEDQTIYHLVLAGETKFGLSKKYDISIKDLENNNPQTVPTLLAGQKILIRGYASNENKATEIIEAQNLSGNSNTHDVNIPSDNESDDYVDYQVKSEDTVLSLTKKASMSQSDFLTLNPSLQKGLLAGMIVKMPKDALTKTFERPVKETILNESPKPKNIDFSANLIDYPSNISYADLSKNIDYSKQVKIVFVFSNDVSSIDEGAIESSEDALLYEYYKGALLAVDSMKRMGNNVEASFLNTKANDFKTGTWKDKFINANLIIGTFDTNRFEEVVSFAKEHNKDLVVPFRQTKIDGSSNLIYAFPTEYHQKIFMIDYMNSLKANIIIITDDLESDSSKFIRGYDATIKFAPLDFKGIINNERFKLMFDKNKINYVVLDTDKNSLIISSTNFLLNESNNYGIKLALFKSRELINSPDISDIRLKVLQLIYPAVLNPNEKQITSFKALYVNKYDKMPSKEAQVSFDITLDMILRRVQNSDFQDDLLKVNSFHDYMKFQYKSYQNSFWNSGIFIIKYE
jgi:LysM repeat protein